MKPTSAPLSLSILLLFAARCLCQVAEDADVCCDIQPSCKNITPMNITIDEYANQSPYFEPILSSDYYSDTYQSVCNTYFQIREGLYLEFRVIKKKDGNASITMLLVADYPGTPGKFRVQGLLEGNSTIVYDSYVVDAICQSCQQVYMYYKCYYYDICDFVDAEYNDVNGKSSSADVPSSCLDAFQPLAESLGFNVRGFVRPPGGSYACVAYYGNNTCVNYDRISPADRIRYPPEDDVPQTC